MSAPAATARPHGWESIRWPLNLASPPEVLAWGASVHGGHGNERFEMGDFWALHLYPYEASLLLDGERFPIAPGYAGITPPGGLAEYEFAHASRHLFMHFRCAPGPAPADTIPAMQDLGAEFQPLYRRLEVLVADIDAPLHHRRARLWDLLCELARRPAEGRLDAAPLHPAVQQAIQEVELGLGRELSVAELARRTGVSHSQLGRLFRQAFGCTVVGYIRERRMRRASHLLTHTDLSVAAVARAVGMPDLHHFNKTVRRTFGCSPRGLLHDARSKIDAGSV